MKFNFPRRLTLLCSVLFIAATASTVHAVGIDYRLPKYKKTATLMVFVEKKGAMRTMLTMTSKLENPAAVRQALSQSFNYPLTFDPPRDSRYRFEDTYSFIEGRSDHAYDEQTLTSRLDIRPALLARELSAQGVETLDASIWIVQRFPNMTVSGATERRNLFTSYYEATINTENPDNADIAFSWGYRRSDIVFQSIPIPLFFIVPMILTFCVGRSVLKMKDRPIEMWGRYFRYLARLMNGIWLLWFPVYAWSNMSEILPRVWGPGVARYANVITNLIWIVPPMVVMWGCHLVSRNVYRNVRGAEWSPEDVVRRLMVAGSLAFLPLFGVVLGLNIAGGGLRQMALVLFVVTAGVFVVYRLLGKSVRFSLYSVTRGELRDRIFSLAERAGVQLKQIYVLPDDKAQLSNAFARSDNAVMLTASLLRHLSKREVDAIMAHEIGHLKEKHPQHKFFITTGTLMVAVIASTMLASLIDVERWSPAILSFTIMGSFFLLHFISRSNERRADNIGVRLTGDPDGFISGLAKLSRLNLMPIHEGSMFESGTHPQTLSRLQDIARWVGIPAERAQRLMQGEISTGDHYSFAELDENLAKGFSTEFKRAYQLRLAMVSLASILLPPVFTALLLSRLPLRGTVQLVAYLAAIALTFLIYQVVRNFSIGWGFNALEQRVRAHIAKQGLSRVAAEGIFVGLAPGSRLRRYERFAFWDVGLLYIAGNQMIYHGEETSFVLNRHQIADVRVSLIEILVNPRNCTFVEWREETMGGTFQLARIGPVLKSRREVFRLEQIINEWRHGKRQFDAAPETIQPLRAPSFGHITSEPIMVKRAALMLKAMLMLSSISIALSFVLNVSFWGACYALAAVMMLMFVDELPGLLFGKSLEIDGDGPEPPPPYQRGAWAESDTSVSR
jgi:Zn-dependent protease with chaperone function